MKLIKPSFLIKEQEPGLLGIYRQIEYSGRICYKSHDKITEDSAKKFVDRMIQSGHGAVLEHGTVYLRYDFKAEGDSNSTAYWLWSKYNENKYSESVQAQPIPGIPNGFVAITTNYRVLVENDWLDDLKYLCEPTEYHKKRVCVRFICDRGVSHEYVRHRVFSFAQESTRYCNYSKDKFGNELTFIIPCWLDIPEGEAYFHDGINYRVGVTEENIFGESVNPKSWADKNNNYLEVQDYLYALDIAERSYFRLMDKWENKIPDKRYKTGFKGNPWTPQQARAVLPNALKTELVMTGFISDWKHFFDLRCDSAAHPQARELAIPLKEEFIKRGYEV